MASKRLFLIKPRIKSSLDPARECQPGESREEFAALQTEYFERFAPVNLETRFYIDCLIEDEWSLRRWRRIETELRKRPGSEKPLVHVERHIAFLTRLNKKRVVQIERDQRAQRKEMEALECQPLVT
ncbi:MAG: hypothetical protein P4L56_15340 [Candidatus Sulfopaludibacter sp.]|nr:hypothetical protein [Candidatus Sulfopaludibacter sp.]